MITYTWVFDSFECVNYNNMQNVVKIIHWHLIGVNENYSSTALGLTILDDADPATFISFENITEEKAIEWISYYEDIPAVKKNIVSDLNNQQTSSEIISLSPPWIVV